MWLTGHCVLASILGAIEFTFIRVEATCLSRFLMPFQPKRAEDGDRGQVRHCVKSALLRNLICSRLRRAGLGDGADMGRI